MPVEELRRGKSFVREAVDALYPAKVRARPKRVETFQEGCARLRLDEDDLRAAYKQQLAIFFVGITGIALGLTLMVVEVAAGNVAICCANCF